MKWGNLFTLVKWIVIISATTAAIYYLSIIICDYTSIDFYSIFTIMSVVATIIALFLGIQSEKLIRKSNELDKKTKETIEKLEEAIKDSKEIADNSNKTVITIANVEFLRLIGQIEDLRLDFKNSDLVLQSNGEFGPLSRLLSKREIYGWKCYTYIREADSILHQCKVESEYIQRFLNIFNLYLEQIQEVINVGDLNFSFSVEEIHHLLMMLKRILKLNELFNQRQLEEMDYQTKIDSATVYLRNILREDEHILIDLEYVEDIDEILNVIRSIDTGVIYYDINELIRDQYLDSIE